MKVASVRYYAFERSTLLDLHNVLNKFTTGQAVTNVETGTVAYAAGEAYKKEYLTTLYETTAGGDYTAIIVYVEQ